MTQGLTLTGYARYRGCAPRAVEEALAAGRISGKKRGHRWVIDPARADEEWERNTDPLQQERGNGNKRNGSGGLHEEREALTRTQRLLAERKLAEADGRLLDAEEVERAIADQQGRAVALLLSLPDELGPVLAAESDQRKVIELLDQALRKVCALVAGGKPQQ